MLTIDKIKTVEIPRNVSRANNLLYTPVAVYNDSVNLYNAIALVVNSLGAPGATNLGANQTTTVVNITSSTGADTTILAADSTRAGVMTSDDKDNLDNLVDIVGASGAATLPNFAGSIISDGATINTALQELELAIQDTDTNLGTTYSLTDVTITSSTGTSTTIQAASAGSNAGIMTAEDKDTLDNLVSITGMPANSSNLGTFTYSTLTDNATIKDVLQDVENELIATAGSILDVAGDVSNLVTLSGVAVDSTDLGTFTGVTIPDNQTIKQALQVLETNLELVSGGSGATNLGTTYAASTFTVTSDTGTNAVVNAATSLLAGAMTATDKANLEALIALVGTGPLEYDLGTFSGALLSDDLTIKEALQELETAVEAINPSSGLPSGNANDTLYHDGTDWASTPVLANDGTTVAINTTPSTSFDLTVAGAITTEAGIIMSVGSGSSVSSLSGSGLRLLNDSGAGETFNIESSDDGELNIYGGAATPFITIGNDGRTYFNDIDDNNLDAIVAISSELDAPSTTDTLALAYYPSADAALIRFYDDSLAQIGAVHAEGGNLEIEVPSIFTITAGTEGFNFNGTGNFVFPNLVADVGSPSPGSIWYNDTDERFKVETSSSTEELAYYSDLIGSDGSGGDYEVVSAATFTVGSNSSRTIYFRAYSNSIAVTLGPDLEEGVIYYLMSRADGAYAVTFSIPSGYTWWMVGQLNEDLSDATTLSVDSTDKNSYAWVQRRGTRIFTHFLTF